jgi:hypothetical protein
MTEQKMTQEGKTVCKTTPAAKGRIAVFCRKYTTPRESASNQHSNTAPGLCVVISASYVA